MRNRGVVKIFKLCGRRIGGSRIRIFFSRCSNFGGRNYPATPGKFFKRKEIDHNHPRRFIDLFSVC